MSDKITSADVVQLAKSVEQGNYCDLKTKFTATGADFEDQVKAIKAIEIQLRQDRTANMSLPDTFIEYSDAGSGPVVTMNGWGSSPNFSTAYRFDENIPVMDCK